MQEQFGIASFRSRQQVAAFEQALRRHGVQTGIVSTPRAVALGCGLSVKFQLSDARRVQEVYHTAQPGNLIGFYRVLSDGRGRVEAYPLGMEMGYRG